MLTMMRKVATGVGTKKVHGCLLDGGGAESRLNLLARQLRRIVLREGEVWDRFYPGFKTRFVRPFESISAIRFAPLTSGAAFELNKSTGVMTMNTGHATGMFNAILLDVADTNGRSGVENLDESEVSRLMMMALMLLIFHEVRHSSQGVAEYDTMQGLKKLGLERVIGDLDLLADRDAAHAYAILNSIESGDPSSHAYITAFRDALFFMGQYCFPAFKVPQDKPYKVARALGLTMMLARIVLAERDNRIQQEHAGALPLDVALMPQIRPLYDGITILAYTPDLRVLSIDSDIDPTFLSSLCAKLDSAPFLEILEDAICLWRKLRLV